MSAHGALLRRRFSVRVYRDTHYEVLHTGGFVRLCTERGRIYWMAQNETEHLTPDWKLHFSVAPRPAANLARAWDAVASLFLERGLDFGMKAVAPEQCASWPPTQRGRELTVYIFQHSPRHYGDGGGPLVEALKEQRRRQRRRAGGLYDEAADADANDDRPHDFWLGHEFERPGTEYLRFARDAEARLRAAGIRSHGGVADGDLAIDAGVGQFASLRNEAFTPEAEYVRGVGWQTRNIYPRNCDGWNAANHECPLPLVAEC